MAICELCGWVLRAEHYVDALGDCAEVDYAVALGRTPRRDPLKGEQLGSSAHRIWNVTRPSGSVAPESRRTRTAKRFEPRRTKASGAF